MSKFLRLSLIAAVFAIAFNVFAVSEARAQNQIRELLKRMETHQNALKSLRADVTMVKYNAQLEENDPTFYGKVIYVPAKGRDALVRIDWNKPRKESLAVVNKEYVLYTENLKQAIVGKVDSSKGSVKANSALAFLSMSKDELQANYEVRYLGQETVQGGVPTVHLELIPKKAGSYKSADLWVDSNGMPVQAKVTETNGDATTILLSGLEKNVKINSSVFRISPPSGTKIIKG